MILNKRSAQPPVPQATYQDSPRSNNQTPSPMQFKAQNLMEGLDVRRVENQNSGQMPAYQSVIPPPSLPPLANNNFYRRQPIVPPFQTQMQVIAEEFEPSEYSEMHNSIKKSIGNPSVLQSHLPNLGEIGRSVLSNAGPHTSIMQHDEVLSQSAMPANQFSSHLSRQHGGNINMTTPPSIIYIAEPPAIQASGSITPYNLSNPISEKVNANPSSLYVSNENIASSTSIFVSPQETLVSRIRIQPVANTEQSNSSILGLPLKLLQPQPHNQMPPQYQQQQQLQQQVQQQKGQQLQQHQQQQQQQRTPSTLNPKVQPPAPSMSTPFKTQHADMKPNSNGTSITEQSMSSQATVHSLHLFSNNRLKTNEMESQPGLSPSPQQTQRKQCSLFPCCTEEQLLTTGANQRSW